MYGRLGNLGNVEFRKTGVRGTCDPISELELYIYIPKNHIYTVELRELI